MTAPVPSETVLDLLLFAVHRRRVQLKYEIALLQEQMESLSESDLPNLAVKKDIDSILSALYRDYTHVIRANLVRPCPFRRGVQIHLTALTKIHLEDSVMELKERQANVSSENSVESNFGLIKYVDVLFPYDFVFLRILQDHEFVEELLKYVYEYKVVEHRSKVRAIFEMLQGKHEEPFLLVVVAEALVSFFVGDQIRAACHNPVADLVFLENCRYFLSGPVRGIGLSVGSLQPTGVVRAGPPAMGKKHPDYDTDTESVVPGIRHVVLEFRKLATQVSVTWMCSVLLRANEFLTAALALDGSTVGADEIFQYVIVSLADAKLHVLTTLYAILSRFRLVDLATSQVDFLIERLKIAAQFLDGQSVPVPPFVLLPFQQSSPTMVLHSEEPVGIHGFAVWALPTFVKGSAPARLCCTGDPADVAIAYAYDQVDCTVLPENVMTMPTILGAIFHVVAESINPHELIYVPEGDFVRALPDIGLMSNLLLMKRFAWIEGDLSLSLIPSLLEEFCRLWPKVREDRARDSVLAVIKDIQKALIGRSLPRDYQLTGIVDPPLIEALRTEIPAFRKEAVYIDPRIKAWICQLASS